MKNSSLLPSTSCLLFLGGLSPACFHAVEPIGTEESSGNADLSGGTGDGGPAGSCGDGLLDPDEGCDLGDQNDDMGACKTDCTPQTCGDGFVGPGESCDDGNDVGGDGCDNSCALESCGNGVIEPGEGCDDGNPDNADDCLNTCVVAFCGDGYLHVGVEECEDDNFSNFDDCTNDCLAATCGDGYTWANVEQCDDGNTSNGDECLNSCEEASCGDGHLNGGSEECDDGNVADDDGCDANCVLEIKYVFASGAEFTGNLGGIEGADQKCQALADAADLPGIYYAWISIDGNSPALRFTKSTTPYKLVDGTVVADNWVDLTDGSLKHAIDLTEVGAVIDSGGFYGTRVWTGTTDSGSSDYADCNSWTSSANRVSGTVGRSDSINSSWTDYDGDSCGFAFKLYCFRQ